MNDKLTDEQVNEMIAKLEEHYQQPVMPLHNFCDAITTWFRCIEDANINKELVNEKYGRSGHGSDYYEHLHRIEIDIRKSFLLWRLLYNKEKLRTKLCPVHKGHWDGQAQIFYGCLYGCNGSGWLHANQPEPTEEQKAARLVELRKIHKLSDEEMIAKVKQNDMYKFNFEEWLMILDKEQS